MKPCTKCKASQLCNPLTGRCRKCQSFEKLTLTRFAQFLNLNAEGSKKTLCETIRPHRKKLKKEITTGLTAIQESVAKRKELQDELTVLSALLQKERTNKAKLRENLRKLQKRAKATKKLQDRARSKKQRTQVAEATKELQEEYRRLKAQLEDTGVDMTSLRKDILIKKQQLQVQSQALEETEQKLVEMKRSKELIETALQRRTEEKAASIAKLDALTTKFNAQLKEYQQLQELHSQFTADQKVLATELTTLATEKQELAEQLANLKREISQQEKKSKDADASTLERLQLEIETNKQDLSDIQEELADKQVTEVETKQALQAATSAMQEAKAELTKLEQKFDTFKATLRAETQGTLEKSAEEVRLLESALQAQKNDISQALSSGLSCATLPSSLNTVENTDLKKLLVQVCAPQVPKKPVKRAALTSKVPTKPEVPKPQGQVKAGVVKTKERLEKERELREAQEQTGQIAVNVRIRPLIPARETEADFEIKDNGHVLVVPDPETAYRISGQVFYDPTAEIRPSIAEQNLKIKLAGGQEIDGGPSEEFYQRTAASDVEAYIKGQTAAIYAYGPSGTGKTVTMDYITDRAVETLLASKDAKENKGVDVAFIDIYIESSGQAVASDLQKEDAKTEAPKKLGSRDLERLNVAYVKVQSMEEFRAVKAKIRELRVTSATAFNPDSSRSHLITLLNTRRYLGKTGKLSVLALVDLAGSEDLSQDTLQKVSKRLGVSLPTASKVFATLQAESKAINESLKALSAMFGDISRELEKKRGDEQGAVAARQSRPESKFALVQLSRVFVTPTTRVSMVVCLSPADHQLKETHESMEFAQAASGIQLGAKYFLWQKLDQLTMEELRFVDKVVEIDTRMKSHPDSVLQGYRNALIGYLL